MSKKLPHILSIQSHVASGYVGNRAAVFTMQRLGCEVSFINTVQFSNHTGHGRWKGQIFTAEHIQDIVNGLDELGIMHTIDGVLSGYMGDANIGHIILDTVKKIKALNPNALYCFDPVIGDTERGIYVRAGIPEFMQEHAIAVADIITPNHFELSYLTQKKLNTFDDIADACNELHQKGPKMIVVTSIHLGNLKEDEIGMLVSDTKNVWLVKTPYFKLAKSPTGSGDLVASLFFAHYLKTQDVANALSATASSTYGIFKSMYEANGIELPLISAQEEIVQPSHLFTAEKIR